MALQKADMRAPVSKRSPRTPLIVLGAIAVASAISVSFLGWKMLEQNKALEGQRARDRIENDADRIVENMRSRFAAVNAELAMWLAQTATPTPMDSGVGVLMAPNEVRVVGSPPLLFQPVVARQAEAPASMFAEAEALEYRSHDSARATDAYERLAQSPDPAARAGGLMRLARVQKSLGALEKAIATYDRMSQVRNTTVFERPADLVALVESARLTAQTGRRDQSRQLALRILDDLGAGRWLLTRGQYDAIIEDVAELTGRVPAFGTRYALSLAVADLWRDWRSGTLAPQPRVVRTPGPFLVMWRGDRGRAAAWFVEPVNVVASLALDPSILLTLSDGEGVLSGDAAGASAVLAVRTAVDTRLPWTIQVSHGGGGPSGGGTSRALVISGLVLMLVFLTAGSFFIGRAMTREADLARAQSDFVSAVSHEFRTPLAAMRQYSELLAAGRVPDDRRQHYFDSMAGESRRLQRLVENILNFGRLEAGAKLFDRRPVELRGLVQDVVDEYRSQLSKPDCQITIDGSNDATTLLADREAVALALHNLVDNAVKYSGRGRPVSISWARRTEHIAVSVRDEGPGISSDEQPQLFDRFFRGAAAKAASIRGTGIGLAMVKLVAAGHGGDVTVESRPGAGSTFTMLFPAGDGR